MRSGQWRQGSQGSLASLASDGEVGGLNEHLQFNRGEVGIDDENFSRKLGGKKRKRDPKIEYANMQRWVSFLNRSFLLI